MMRYIVYPALGVLLASSSACFVHRGGSDAERGGATLEVDSAQYTLKRKGEFYTTTIGYHYTNHTGALVSANHCFAPPPPMLEKQSADGRWVGAGGSVQLTCLRLPPFRIPDGGSYAGTYSVLAARRDANIFPKLDIDSVTGNYRLRWALRAGEDPDDNRAPEVVAISNVFRLIGP